jgi:hypothetical protein
MFGLVAVMTACGHTTSAAPPAARAPDTHAAQRSVPDAERSLYEIIYQLVRDPAAQTKLAPAARVVFHGEETVEQPLSNAYEELGWVRETNPPFIAAGAPAPETEESYVRCVAAELRCTIEQPGGETIFHFARATEGDAIVLSMVESEDP